MAEAQTWKPHRVEQKDADIGDILSKEHWMWTFSSNCILALFKFLQRYTASEGSNYRLKWGPVGIILKIMALPNSLDKVDRIGDQVSVKKMLAAQSVQQTRSLPIQLVQLEDLLQIQYILFQLWIFGTRNASHITTLNILYLGVLAHCHYIVLTDRSKGIKP